MGNARMQKVLMLKEQETDTLQPKILMSKIPPITYHESRKNLRWHNEGKSKTNTLAIHMYFSGIVLTAIVTLLQILRRVQANYVNTNFTTCLLAFHNIIVPSKNRNILQAIQYEIGTRENISG